MQRVTLAGTELETSRLGFGTASLHHALRTRERQALLGAALDAGFTHFDTARLYGDGMAERELGRFLRGKRSQVTIATKFGIPAIPLFERFPPLLYAHRAMGDIGRRLLPRLWDYRRRVVTPEGAEFSLTSSLKALQTDSIDLLLVHEPEASDVEPLARMADWLERQKARGRVRYLGLAGNARICAAVARQTGGLFDVLQVEDSLSGREADVLIESGRPLQITFGYLRQAAVEQPPPGGLAVTQCALARNPRGLVLVSSRQAERLRALAALAA